ncbi:MAG: GntR family transcriptional regulator [Pseudobutyrivibrio sp.]|nr:GntR family transcriptional regulator [Pseudobutyrivibrio sp.]
MNFNSNAPIYLQVVDAIKLDIINGRLKAGDKLPSGRDLAVKYTINPNTAARVYQELERQEICFTKRGMGTFVTEDQERIKLCKSQMAEETLTSFLLSLNDLGITKEEAIEMINEANDICIV